MDPSSPPRYRTVNTARTRGRLSSAAPHSAGPLTPLALHRLRCHNCRLLLRGYGYAVTVNECGTRRLRRPSLVSLPLQGASSWGVLCHRCTMAVGRELRLVAVMGVMTKWPIRADAEPSIAAHRRSCFISSVDGDGYKVGKGPAAQANWRRTVATNGRAGRLHIRYTIDGSWPDPTDGAKTSERRYRLFGTGMSPGLAHHPVGLLRSATSRCLLTQAGSHSSYGGPGQKVALETSLVSLYTHYNERFRDPVWIFHEGDFMRPTRPGSPKAVTRRRSSCCRPPSTICRWD
eukprot:scaffold2403_cov141-Isochrysis_galbana.AAC.7